MGAEKLGPRSAKQRAILVATRSGPCLADDFLLFQRRVTGSSGSNEQQWQEQRRDEHEWQQWQQRQRRQRQWLVLAVAAPQCGCGMW